MGDELDNEENPPAFSSILLDNIEFAIANGQNVAAESTGIFHDGRSAGADSMPFPYTPFRNAPFPWKHMHGTYQSYEHNVPETCSDLMIDLNQLHNLQNPLIDSNSINVDSNIPWMSGQDLQHHEWDLNGVSCALDETWTADNVMNDTAHFNSLRNPESNRNFPPINDNASYYPLLNDNAGRGYAMARQGGEAYISNTYEPQMKNFVGLGGIKTCNAQNSEGFSTENNDNICAAQSGCPKKFDGSFLSLGVGRNTHVEPKSDHGSREVNLRLDGAVSSQLYTSSVHQATRSSMNLGPNGTYSSFQNNVGGFRSVGNHAGGWTSSNNNVGLNSRQFHILQKPQAEMQHHFPPSSARNLGMLGDRDARYANLDACKGFIGELTRSSGPCSSSSTGLHDSGPIGGSGLASESVKLSRTTSQPTSDQLHRCLMETVQNFSPESSLRSSFMRFKGSSTRQEHSGQEFSVNNGTKPHVSAGGLVPKRIGVEDRKVSAAQAATSDLLAQRLGVQVNEHRAAQAAGHGMFAKSTGIQVTDGRVAYAAERGLFPKDIRVQMASRPPLPSSDLRGPSFTTASSQEGLQMQFSKEHIGPTSTTGGSSLKRGAIQPPPAAPRVLRRKITPQPFIHPSMPRPQTTPAAPIPIPSPVTHVKWKGCDGRPQPLGQKCLLCKRDLSFAPEGHIHQPTIPPAVAVLPCAHTFHDHCLQLITPQDQSKDPPCIPCAIGDI